MSKLPPLPSPSKEKQKQGRKNRAEGQLFEALRFCGAGKEPCSKCPFWEKLDPEDCQTQIMLKAADELERLSGVKGGLTR